MERRAGIEPANTGLADPRVCLFAAGMNTVEPACTSLIRFPKCTRAFPLVMVVGNFRRIAHPCTLAADPDLLVIGPFIGTDTTPTAVSHLGLSVLTVSERNGERYRSIRS
jgi:hypothetical protein